MTEAPSFSVQQPDTFRARASRAFTSGGGKELAHKVSRADVSQHGMWETDAIIRGYDLGGWKGYAEALTGHVTMGGAAIGLDQLESVVRDHFQLVEKSKEAVTRLDSKNKPEDWPNNVKWESPLANVVDNFEDSFTDWVIAQGANAAVGSVVINEQPGKPVEYTSPVSDLLSDGINLFAYAKFGATGWKKVKDWVSPTSTEAILRAVNVTPVVGAWLEKNVYTKVNHALERSKFAQFVGGWGVKSLLWYVLGRIDNEKIAASHAE